MLIGDSTARALDAIAAREREVLNIFPQTDSLERSGQLHCEPPPGCYFIAREENGVRTFLRPSALYFSGGVLTDGNGRPILGYTAPTAALSPLRTEPVDSALGWAGEAHIGSDGVVGYDRSVIDPLSGDRHAQYVTIGRLAVARFPAGTKVTGAPPQGIEPHLGVPGEGGFAALNTAQKPFDRELDDGLQRLQEAYLSLDALRAAGDAQGSVQKTTMDLLK